MKDYAYKVKLKQVGIKNENKYYAYKVKSRHAGIKNENWTKTLNWLLIWSKKSINCH